ncbi:DUF2993 domain-containing protein [Corynebacterium halotolerans]|uniref:LmeA family phospholipid-binding protein n=1 Tax=Corynebacterium halotolerans TaxID=225326 RepID=UPI003CF991F8
MYLPRKLVVTLAAVLSIGAVLWLVDSVVATRVEHRISQTVAEHSRLETNPGIYVAGFPYLQALLTNELPMVSADALDVDVPGIGTVNARSEITELVVEPNQVLSGDIIGAPAELITRTISLDGVALGNLLGMTDLDIANPYDMSPSGGGVTEAQFTGTPEAFDEPVTVVVTLRLDGPIFRMTPRELVDVPDGREQEVAAAFTWELDTRQLPLAGQAQAVYAQGGSIYFRAQKRNVPLKMEDLSPIEASPEDSPEAAGGDGAEDPVDAAVDLLR